jgi:hypothetical protein
LDLPITRRDLACERTAVIFTLTALYSQLAAGEDAGWLEQGWRKTCQFL